MDGKKRIIGAKARVGRAWRAGHAVSYAGDSDKFAVRATLHNRPRAIIIGLRPS